MQTEEFQKVMHLLYENIEVNASEKGGKWIGHDRTAKQIKTESDAFFNKIEEIKTVITEKQKLKDPELKGSFLKWIREKL